MAAKMRAHAHGHQIAVAPRGGQDVANMRAVLALKIAQHPELHALLLSTNDAQIIEDCSKRATESGLFWGAAWRDGEWQGRNTLGVLWMELRDELRRRASWRRLPPHALPWPPRPDRRQYLFSTDRKLPGRAGRRADPNPAERRGSGG